MSCKVKTVKSVEEAEEYASEIDCKIPVWYSLLMFLFGCAGGIGIYLIVKGIFS